MQTKFHEPGCYADGTYGAQHIREVLADLIEPMGLDITAKQLRRDSAADWPEDEAAAIEALNESPMTPPFSYWKMVDGDLMLLADVSRLSEEIHFSQLTREPELAQISDLSEADALPTSIRGYLLVNDHGNASYYERSPEGDVLCWSVV